MWGVGLGGFLVVLGTVGWVCGVKRGGFGLDLSSPIPGLRGGWAVLGGSKCGAGFRGFVGEDVLGCVCVCGGELIACIWTKLIHAPLRSLPPSPPRQGLRLSDLEQKELVLRRRAYLDDPPAPASSSSSSVVAVAGVGVGTVDDDDVVGPGSDLGGAAAALVEVVEEGGASGKANAKVGAAGGLRPLLARLASNGLGLGLGVGKRKGK